ncbi:MAG: YggS family pyridoxal phosphate-dependent enzyme [Clostridium septicum]|uniref:Pyridoxal phosphate homeostasis protein n=2 Tax=Clostridium septicum TaxID=1504 RepID=A0A9N7JPC0_CLOSE|nr:YggS family pyridoxal phosphate-dependent enzyme [Clostridium septicum]AYE35616.1 YggS family pyridoxal phosphate-dependent enzyme [Clostridium septicum]MDU1313212.1 YggS family pyridoxal phosphate-dependent enzyme [Clostridium septicum]QAS61003.1 YggS family pyridoxal phosphate-dependent enzyme [Clostridium septicum]UEC19718.1 YggS family pyridoxal phosphate-dependent enzyme [Clostridium septicum]USS02221.1 YggS family pyridoxal phosphate-dependent enzyme [Clostridium septicum]
MEIEDKVKSIMKNISRDVLLLAVSKTKPLEDLEKAYKSGIRDFGENKVQELIAKEEVFHKDVRWHFIGNLQVNKVKYLVGKVTLIHSLSSLKLLEKIENEFSKKNLVANTLIQINIGREESKGGVLIEELDNMIEAVEKCNFVKVKGIMVIIPKGNDKSNRIYFKETKKIFNSIKQNKYKNISMEILSMGMTNDYEIAIEEGSNLVRIGSGIFGKRNI